MNKQLLVASICAAFAIAAGAQTPASLGTETPGAAPSDVSKMMDIPNWQTTVSDGQAAAKANPNTPGATDAARAADLSKLTDIPNMQATQGDAAASARTPSSPAALDNGQVQPGLDQALGNASTQ